MLSSLRAAGAAGRFENLRARTKIAFLEPEDLKKAELSNGSFEDNTLHVSTEPLPERSLIQAHDRDSVSVFACSLLTRKIHGVAQNPHGIRFLDMPELF